MSVFNGLVQPGDGSFFIVPCMFEKAVFYEMRCSAKKSRSMA